MHGTELAGALRDAMQAERDGYSFYSMAADRSEDPGARDTFTRLAAEEKKHYEMLQSGYRALLQGEPWKPSSIRSGTDHERQAGGIFSERFVRRIAGKHLEMSALSIGILLEKNAVAFYSREAEAANDKAVATFFRELADWENEHYQLLLRQDESLKEAYWNENRFAPLL